MRRMKAAYEESLWFIVISVGLLAAGCAAGALWPQAFHTALAPALEKLQSLARVTTGHSVLVRIGVIFGNNVLVAVLLIALGVVAGAFPAWTLWFNGVTIGYVCVEYAAKLHTLPWKVFVFALLPHGIFELTAFVWAGAIGLRLGFDALGAVVSGVSRAGLTGDGAKAQSAPMSRGGNRALGSTRRTMRQAWRQSVRRLPAIIVILFFAACIESTITPRLIHMIH